MKNQFIYILLTIIILLIVFVAVLLQPIPQIKIPNVSSNPETIIVTDSNENDDVYKDQYYLDDYIDTSYFGRYFDRDYLDGYFDGQYFSNSNRYFDGGNDIYFVNNTNKNTSKKKIDTPIPPPKVWEELPEPDDPLLKPVTPSKILPEPDDPLLKPVTPPKIPPDDLPQNKPFPKPDKFPNPNKPRPTKYFPNPNKPRPTKYFPNPNKPRPTKPVNKPLSLTNRIKYKQNFRKASAAMAKGKRESFVGGYQFYDSTLNPSVL